MIKKKHTEHNLINDLTNSFKTISLVYTMLAKNTVMFGANSGKIVSVVFTLPRTCSYFIKPHFWDTTDIYNENSKAICVRSLQYFSTQYLHLEE